MLAIAGSRLGLIPRPEIETSPSVLLIRGPQEHVRRAITKDSRRSPSLAATRGIRPWAQTLARKRVVVAMDCGCQGRDAAARISSDLTGVATGVTTADVAPHLDDGYDLADWLDARTMNTGDARVAPPVRANAIVI